jgi:F-type H+-transporting ATPase subunit epsilon
MAEEQLHLEIVTPDSTVLSEEVQYVGVPGTVGQFGVMKNHIPFLSALAIGSLYYRKGGTNQYVFISGGFAEVTSDSVSILAESAERAEEIDVQRAQKAKERAEERLRQQQENIDQARAEAALKRAIQRMTVGEKAGSSH